jgi:hypothetical protein
MNPGRGFVDSFIRWGVLLASAGTCPTTTPSASARRCGYRIHADTTLRLSRLASYAYSWEEAGTTPPRYARFDLHLPAG